VYDLVILGGGPGGYAAAIRAGHLGLTVVLVEKEAVGGACLHHGCIPSKTLLHGADVLASLERASAFGIRAENVRSDFAQAVDRSRAVIQKLNDGLAHQLRTHRVEVVIGTGTLAPPDGVEVITEAGRQTLQGRHLLIATGSRVGDLPGLVCDGRRIYTSDEALVRRHLPQSVALIGGGAVGCELAYLYALYGVQVTLIEAAPALLPREDEAISALLKRSFQKRGIAVWTGTPISSVEDRGDTFSLRCAPDGAECQIEAILVAVGRRPNVEGMGLASLGIALEGGAIAVDAWMRTTVPNVYAVGDVTTRPALAHGAMAQGVAVAERLAGMDRAPIDPLCIPNAIYCDPQVASVGLTEAAARQTGRPIKVARFPFSALGKAVAIAETEGFVKMVADAASDEILGAHIIGPNATEMIGVLVLAKTIGLPASRLPSIPFPHPTLSEAISEAACAFRAPPRAV